MSAKNLITTKELAKSTQKSMRFHSNFDLPELRQRNQVRPRTVTWADQVTPDETNVRHRNTRVNASITP